jgi:hypothetical protein
VAYLVIGFIFLACVVFLVTERWRQSSPRLAVRRFLRTRNVVTWLSAAGVTLTGAALAVVIGIGQVQIQASLKKSGDLYADGWFDIGLVFAAVAIILGVVAVCANASQAKARSEFPDISIHVRDSGVSRSFPIAIHPAFPAIPGEVARYSVGIINRELTRKVSLVFTLHCTSLLPGGTQSVLPRSKEWTSAEIDREGISGPIPSQPLPVGPINVPPTDLVQGDLLFEAIGPPGSWNWQAAPTMEILDVLSQTTKMLDAPVAKIDARNAFARHLTRPTGA